MNYWPFALTSLVVVALPFLLAALLRRWRQTPWLYFIVGVITFTGAQVVHYLLNELLLRVGLLPSERPDGAALVVMAVVLGLTAGLTEELGRAVGYRLFPQARRYRDGLMMGLGHGGIEAVMVGVLMAAGISALANLDSVGFMPAGASTEEYATLQQQLDLIEQVPLAFLAPFAERLIALGAQITLSIMVLTAFVKKQWLLIVLAILYHALLDCVAVLGPEWSESPWPIELALFLLVLPGLFWTWRQRRTESDTGLLSKGDSRVDLALFWTSLRKELLFQWRTKRMLIVVAIFLVFGMVSPLIAKFTPQLIASLEETASFADLIPDPTVADAIAQYMSNLTQFGFVLVILLGMNAVAGEKEKGTAAMVLSKPLPRWIMITSKYFAQGVVYLLALALACIACYYYTLYLFEGLSAAGFLLANALLFLWLMVFAAITLVGSSIGKSTATAAGIALLGGILLLVIGVIPRYGALGPSGLVNWATASSLDLGGAVNGGAVAFAFGLILVTLIASIAAVEEQEI